MANYSNTMKRGSNVFKNMNRSINHITNQNHYQSINSIPSIKNLHDSSVEIKLPNLDVSKSLVNKRSSYDESTNLHNGLIKNASKVKIVSRNDLDVISSADYHLDRRSIHSLDHRSNNSGSKHNSLSPNQIDSKHIKLNNMQSNHKNSIVIEDSGSYNNKEIIA